MKPQALLFLQRSDIAHFCKDPAPYAGLKQIFIDPGLVEEAVQRGLDPALFDYRPLDVGRHFQARVVSEATARALRIDQKLTALRQSLLGKGVFQGWDQVALRFFFIRALVARELGALCDRTFPERSIGLFRPSCPQQFYFDSFVTADVFAGGSPRWSVVDHYDDAANWVPHAYSVCFDFERIQRRAAEGSVEAVSHIPTVYYHLPHFARQILGRFPATLELPSPFWDVPMQREREPLVRLEDLGPRFVSEVCVVYRERARQVFLAEFADILANPQALSAQADMLAQQCFVQAVNYLGLTQALRGTQPHFVLTDHDTGSVGPLFSVAERLGSPITVLPHSSYPAQMLPHAIGVTAIERDGFRTPLRTVLGERVKVRALRVQGRRDMLERPRVATVCLLLNTMSSHGLSHVDFAGLVAFHRTVADACARHGVRLLVRLKPNAASLMIVAGSLGISDADLQKVLASPLEEVAAASDLCLAYGEPSTACAEFMESGCHVVHVSEQCWPADYLSCPDMMNMVSVPLLRGADAAALVERMIQDEDHYRQQSRQQSAEFAARLDAQDDRLFGDH